MSLPLPVVRLKTSTLIKVLPVGEMIVVPVVSRVRLVVLLLKSKKTVSTPSPPLTMSFPVPLLM